MFKENLPKKGQRILDPKTHPYGRHIPRTLNMLCYAPKFQICFSYLIKGLSEGEGILYISAIGDMLAVRVLTFTVLVSRMVSMFMILVEVIVLTAKIVLWNGV